jgi:hypothetical protein
MDSQGMNFGRCSTERCAATVTARKDETFTSTGHPDDWLHKAAARFRSAITLQIPVGYEDETGFHCVPCGIREAEPSKHESEHTF